MPGEPCVTNVQQKKALDFSKEGEKAKKNFHTHTHIPLDIPFPEKKKSI